MAFDSRLSTSPPLPKFGRTEARFKTSMATSRAFSVVISFSFANLRSNTLPSVSSLKFSKTNAASRGNLQDDASVLSSGTSNLCHNGIDDSASEVAVLRATAATIRTRVKHMCIVNDQDISLGFSQRLFSVVLRTSDIAVQEICWGLDNDIAL
ncbi:hypothetical protein HG531_011072 [Fusarium graminearum]|nr:hypothetical protein HG531_011072 [Fusarium graminearum]